jgi:hypothetical protein
LSRSIVGGSREIRLMVDPIGSPNVHMTEPMTVGPSRWVDLNVASPLRFSFFSLWYR